MSATYADAVANSGPPQTVAESAAPQMPEIEHTESETQSLIDVDTPHISSVPSDFETQSVQTDTQHERLEREEEEFRRRAANEAKKVEKAAKRLAGKAERNAGNPVVIGNVVVLSVVGAVLGVGAYRKFQRDGGFSWGLIGTWSAAVAAVAVGDYFVSRWLLQKYPPRE